jgi:glycolate oxidase FAD binding subunit
VKLEVRASDAIAGRVPHTAYAPSSVDECAEVMTAAAKGQLRLGFIGGGTALELGAAPTALDAVVRSERLTRILEHAPADMVIVVEAGATLAAVQAAVGAHGQRLALDAPLAERATIGGLIATGAFGPLRARYGTIRDLIIGVTLVRADGEVARGGGKVVKNVAGFDLPKVACGSLGTLGLIAAAAFRLHPLPEITTTVLAAGLSADAVVALVAAMRQAQLEPASAVALTARGGFDLGVRFEGFARGVEHQVARLIELTAATGTTADRLPDADAAAFWRRHDAVRAAAPLRVRVTGLPTRFPAVAALVSGPDRLGDFAWYATLGVGFAGGPAGDLAVTTAAITAARAQLVADGGSLVVEAAPSELRAAIDPWGPPPGSFAIMQRLKQRFDPDRRLNPGRFVGGL